VYYFKRYTKDSDNPEWGGATYYFETNDYGLPLRELAVYENGKVFGYDRQHPQDEHGHLPAEPLFERDTDKRAWHAYEITTQEFEERWQNPHAPTAAASSGSPKALKLVHTTGTWALVLGVLIVIVSPLVAAALYTPQLASGLTKPAFVTASFVIGAIEGGIYIAIGLSLRRITAGNLPKSRPLLITLSVLLVGFAIIGLVAGGSGFGILNLIVLIDAIRSLGAIKKSY
jgi:tryptophan-rich sensory protein